jgi:hypothetical protein
MARSSELKIVLCGVALASGVDDLIELWLGVGDVFKLDVAHGVVLTAFTGVLDPLCKLVESNDKRLERLGAQPDPD